jgi:hypothetical protein
MPIHKAPTSRNTGGVVVTYNPDDGLAERVSSLANQVDRFLVVDNGSRARPLATVHRLETLAGVELRPHGRNLGVSTAFNQAAEWARERLPARRSTFDAERPVMPPGHFPRDYQEGLTCRHTGAGAQLTIIGDVLCRISFLG